MARRTHYRGFLVLRHALLGICGTRARTIGDSWHEGHALSKIRGRAEQLRAGRGGRRALAAIHDDPALVPAPYDSWMPPSQPHSGVASAL